MTINAYQAAKQFRDIVDGVKKDYERAVHDEQHYSDECTDLVHALELLKLTPRQRLELGSQLGVSRWNRRKAKEDKELLQPLAEYLRRQKGMAGELAAVVERIEELQQLQAVRVYTPKVRKDLGATFAHRQRERTAAAAGYVRRVRRVRYNLS
ncbi:hypothetical protein NST04_33570 [Paenibacillus sp. FSL H7-0756]|uniref:hypothetical protein n=1 Tax=Paenibacillus sp. FSL H7-0756 TaxID=2954738 RepID=UPI0030F8233B